MPERGFAAEYIRQNSVIGAEIIIRAYQKFSNGQDEKGYTVNLHGVYYLDDQDSESQETPTKKREGILYSPRRPRRGVFRSQVEWQSSEGFVDSNMLEYSVFEWFSYVCGREMLELGVIPRYMNRVCIC